VERKSHHSEGISKITEHRSRLSDDLLAIDDKEARGSGRWLSGIGGRETTTREVVDARDSGGGE